MTLTQHSELPEIEQKRSLCHMLVVATVTLLVISVPVLTLGLMHLIGAI